MCMKNWMKQNEKKKVGNLLSLERFFHVVLNLTIIQNNTQTTKLNCSFIVTYVALIMQFFLSTPFCLCVHSHHHVTTSKISINFTPNWIHDERRILYLIIFYLHWFPLPFYLLSVLLNFIWCRSFIFNKQNSLEEEWNLMKVTIIALKFCTRMLFKCIAKTLFFLPYTRVE